MSWPHILQNSQNCSLFSLLPTNFLCSVFIEWDSLVSLPWNPELAWHLTRDDDLDCEPRDVWVTPFTPILMKRYPDAQWGASRGAGEFEIPRVHLNSFWSCIYICITLLNIHTEPGLWITQLISRVSWYRYHHDITRPKPDTQAWLWLDYTNTQCASHYFQIPQ